MSERKLLRLTIAVIVSGPVASAFLSVVYAHGILPIAEPENSPPLNMFADSISGGAFFGALVGWPAALLIMLPAHSLLLNRKRSGLVGYLLAGLAQGFLAAGCLVEFVNRALPPAPAQSASSTAFLALIGLLGGVLAAWIFWLVRRPDRDAPPRVDAAAKPPDLSAP